MPGGRSGEGAVRHARVLIGSLLLQCCLVVGRTSTCESPLLSDGSQSALTWVGGTETSCALLRFCKNPHYSWLLDYFCRVLLWTTVRAGTAPVPPFVSSCLMPHQSMAAHQEPAKHRHSSAVVLFGRRCHVHTGRATLNCFAVEHAKVNTLTLTLTNRGHESTTLCVRITGAWHCRGACLRALSAGSRLNHISLCNASWLPTHASVRRHLPALTAQSGPTICASRYGGTSTGQHLAPTGRIGWW